MNDEERTAWIALALGIAVVSLLAVFALDSFDRQRLGALIGLAGLAAGYVAWRFLPQRPRGPRGYWRGRPYN